MMSASSHLVSNLSKSKNSDFIIICSSEIKKQQLSLKHRLLGKVRRPIKWGISRRILSALVLQFSAESPLKIQRTDLCQEMAES